MSCSRYSQVCQSGQKPTFLPGQKYVSCSKTDLQYLHEVVDYKMGNSAMMRQLHLQNTNKSEAFHRKMFTTLPKAGGTYTKNVLSRAHGQLLQVSHGVNGATYRLYEQGHVPLSAHGPGRKTLQHLSQRDRYWAERAKSFAIKRQRKCCDKKRRLLKRASGSLYETGKYHAKNDHVYAQNVFNM